MITISSAAADDSDEVDSEADDEVSNENFPAPVGVDGVWWRKLEPLLIRKACKSCWIPGSNVSLDEMMVKSYGRSEHTTTMPNKPISQGYKIWALCERGYLFSFMYSSRVHGTGELIKQVDYTKTASMVLQFGEQLPKQVGFSYTIFIDNYFTSIKLFQELRDGGIGACGTLLGQLRRRIFRQFCLHSKISLAR